MSLYNYLYKPLLLVVLSVTSAASVKAEVSFLGNDTTVDSMKTVVGKFIGSENTGHEETVGLVLSGGID